MDEIFSSSTIPLLTFIFSFIGTLNVQDNALDFLVKGPYWVQLYISTFTDKK
jgi:hypothetical protein